MQKILLSLLLLLAVACSNFSSVEKHRIGKPEDSEMIMALFTNQVPEELRFLHLKAGPLNRRDMKTKVYATLKGRMLITVRDTTNPGVGIAAPQIGISKQLIAVQRLDKEGEPFEFYVNPVIEKYSEEKKWGWEGCLSVPGERDTVLRSTQVVIAYRNQDSWQTVRDTISGFTAVIFQHEIDHLNGKLYID
ncbi:MAG: peptide deformylase [Bacteroidales bacterium]|jgi:peptide deformylase